VIALAIHCLVLVKAVDQEGAGFVTVAEVVVQVVAARQAGDLAGRVEVEAGGQVVAGAGEVLGKSVDALAKMLLLFRSTLSP
jgi:hypothetical protein